MCTVIYSSLHAEMHACRETHLVTFISRVMRPSSVNGLWPLPLPLAEAPLELSAAAIGQL